MIDDRAPITSDSKRKEKSPQQLYVEQQKAAGLVQVSGWVPTHTHSDFVLMMSLCRDDRDLTPSTVRSIKTGRMKGINS